MRVMLKKNLISIVEYSIQAIRVAANSEDIYMISSELEHLIKVLDLFKNRFELEDYLKNTQKKYIEKIGEDYENPYVNLWNELEKNMDELDDFILVLDELENLIIEIIIIGVNNIVSYANSKDFRNIYIEAYHIHNLPSIITTNQKIELIKYYQVVERRQYLKESQKVARKKFKDIWKELDKRMKPKRKWMSIRWLWTIIILVCVWRNESLQINFDWSKAVIKRYEIISFEKQEEKINELISKFGGLPVGLSDEKWPISAGWQDRIMMFIGQLLIEKGGG